MGKIFNDSNGRTVYEDRKDAEERTRTGDSIYFVGGLGYYIVRKKKTGFWRLFK